jgi:hypothetical protein
MDRDYEKAPWTFDRRSMMGPYDSLKVRTETEDYIRTVITTVSKVLVLVLRVQ